MQTFQAEITPKQLLVLLRDARSELELAKQGRDALIRTAKAMRLPSKQIEGASGLSRSRLAQIVAEGQQSSQD